MITRILSIALLLMAIPTGPAQAQILRRAQQKVKAKVEQAADKAVDKGIQASENAIKCVITDQACIDKAKEEGKEVVLTDEQGTVLESPADPGQQEGVRPGVGAWANYDFVPGERVLFYEDFTRDRVGNFPQRLEFLHGSMEIVEWDGMRWLRMNSASAFAVPLPEVLPDRFTVEFDATLPWNMFAIYTGESAGTTAPGYLKDRAMLVVSQWYKAGVVGAGGKATSILYPSDVLPKELFTKNRAVTAPVRVRAHVDGSYVKVYLEEHRVANVPTADLLRANKLVFHLGMGPGEEPPLITNISINAGAQPMYDALMADGRFVTQGILFDTGSDQLRPESTPTLEEIAAMLQEHPDLRLRIEGHTDSAGDDAANQALSERRAASMKAFLVTERQIDPARLEAQGLGETTPVGSNETPEGRQQNRRVELVKL